MRIRTLNKRRKLKVREEIVIKYFIKRFGLKRKDIIKSTVFLKTNYGKVKAYLCVHEKANEEYENYLFRNMVKTNKSLRAIFYNKNKPFCELKHSSEIKNEN